MVVVSCAQRTSDHPRAIEFLQRKLDIPGIDPDKKCWAESHLAWSLVKTGQMDEADAAAARAIAANAPTPAQAAFAYHTAAECKEVRADACAIDIEKTAIFEAAMAALRTALKISPDQATQQVLGRIEGKMTYGKGLCYLGQHQGKSKGPNQTQPGPLAPGRHCFADIRPGDIIGKVDIIPMGRDSQEFKTPPSVVIPLSAGGLTMVVKAETETTESETLREPSGAKQQK